jgi:hypothetical protein
MAIRVWVWVSLAAVVFTSGNALGQDQAFPDPPRRPEMPRPEFELPGPSIAEVPGAAMPGADPFQLLENSPEVQADLGLTQHQLENLHLAALHYQNKLPKLSRSQPGETPEQVRNEVQQHLLDTHHLIERELTPSQLDRLHQIMLQLAGPCIAVSDPQVGSRLGLSSGQSQALSEACQERSQEMRNAFRPPAPGEDFCAAAANNRERIRVIRASADVNITALLQPTQQATLVQMMGPKIKLEPPIPPNCQL